MKRPNRALRLLHLGQLGLALPACPERGDRPFLPRWPGRRRFRVANGHSGTPGNTDPAPADRSKSAKKLPRAGGSRQRSAAKGRALTSDSRDLGLLRTALTHRSILHEVASAGVSTAHPAALTNERLEFLGDAVLGAVAAEYLVKLDPRADEGQLTRRRVALVRAETLVRWAREIDLGSAYLHLGLGERPGSGSRDRMLAGAFEAVIGAVAARPGIGAARKIHPAPARTRCAGDPGQCRGCGEPKGRLQELLQERYRRAPEYQTVSTQGPDHARTFVVEATFDDTSSAGASVRQNERRSKPPPPPHLSPWRRTRTACFHHLPSSWTERAATWFSVGCCPRRISAVRGNREYMPALARGEERGGSL